jgi:uncharacterized protein YodC (DUF2158 family)
VRVMWSEAFRDGDTVRLMSGGSLMTVLEASKTGVTCQWLDTDADKVQVVTFKPAELTKAKT